MMPIFYINLASRADRRAYMEEQFKRLTLTATRIEAITPADLSAEDIERYCNGENPSFLRRNELACTMSHERCWQELIAGGAGQALVLEDDVRISSRLPEFLAAAADIDAELIRIETTGATTRVFPVHDTSIPGIGLRRFRSTPVGAAGYIIRRSAAEKLLGHPALRLRPVDLVLYDPFEQPGAVITRVLTDPALCQQIGSSDPRTRSVGMSNVVADGVPHIYAKRHPLRHLKAKIERGVRRGVRNALDDIAQRRKGLERRRIPFSPEG